MTTFPHMSRRRPQRRSSGTPTPSGNVGDLESDQDIDKLGQAFGFIAAAILTFFGVFKMGALGIDADIPHFWRFALFAFLSAGVWAATVGSLFRHRDELTTHHAWVDGSLFVGAVSVFILWLDELFDWTVGPMPSAAWRGWLSVVALLLACILVGTFKHLGILKPASGFRRSEEPPITLGLSGSQQADPED